MQLSCGRLLWDAGVDCQTKSRCLGVHAAGARFRGLCGRIFLFSGVYVSESGLPLVASRWPLLLSSPSRLPLWALSTVGKLDCAVFDVSCVTEIGDGERNN